MVNMHAYQRIASIKNLSWKPHEHIMIDFSGGVRLYFLVLKYYLYRI